MVTLVLFVVLTTPCFADHITDSYENTTSNIIKNPVNNFYDEIIDMDFAERGVIYVTMHHHISDVGKVYTENDFPELDIESIEDITSVNPNDKKEYYGNNFRNILKITLLLINVLVTERALHFLKHLETKTLHKLTHMLLIVIRVPNP